MAFAGTMNYKDGTMLFQWLLDEPSADLVTMCQHEGLPYECKAKAESRRREILGERLLLKHIFGTATPLLHNADDMPYIADSETHISVAHTRGWLGIALNNDHAMGIDVERYQRRILGVRNGFLNESEKAWLAPDDELGHMIAWTAKEAIFKTIAERKRVDDYSEEIILDAYKTPRIGEKIVHKGHFKNERFYLETLLRDERLITFCCAQRNLEI